MKLDRIFYDSETTRIGKAVGNLLDFGPYLPITLTGSSKRKLVRVLGVLASLPCFFLVMPILFLPIIILSAIEIGMNC